MHLFGSHPYVAGHVSVTLERADLLTNGGSCRLKCRACGQRRSKFDALGRA